MFARVLMGLVVVVLAIGSWSGQRAEALTLVGLPSVYQILPDLKAKDIDVDMGLFGELLVRAKIKNRGDFFRGTVHLDAQVTFEGQVRYTSVDVFVTLLPGDTVWVEFPPITRAGRPFEITARVFVDPSNRIRERDETNNQRTEGLRNTSAFSYDEVWSR